MHYVLQSLGPHRDLAELFAGNCKYDPVEESRRVRRSIYNMMKCYSKALESTDEHSLRNHISYWLVMTTLIEKGLIEEME